ncbi:MAG: FecR domain-containing protein [Bacteroidales bacterium]|nr:FecR domain-containing protein [Bacteroidales bacterium]
MINKIIQYLKGELNESQRLELADWVNASEENREYFTEIEDSWYAAAINQQGIFDAERAFSKQKKYLNRSTPVSRIIKVLRYAAAIIMLVSFGWMANYILSTGRYAVSQGPVTFTAPYGETASLELSDKTVVQLNAGSTIRFPQSFGKDTREVFLSGEAYFEVTKDQELPFIVHLDHLDVQVLGTSFNVKSYPDDNTVETTLDEGSVRVSKKSSATSEGVNYVLVPGQHLCYNSETSTFNLKEDDTELHTSWKHGYYKFERARLDILVRTIERLYAIDVSIAQEKLESLTFTGSFYKDEPVDDVLKMVEKSTLDAKVTKLDNHRYMIKSKK